jgi:hypothetical protein
MTTKTKPDEANYHDRTETEFYTADKKDNPVAEAPGSTMFLKGIKLERGPDGNFRDSDGCVYALVRASWSRDESKRAGVGLFSLSKENILSKAAGPHDFAYSCPVYQLFHYRIEADRMFLEHAAKVEKEDGKEDRHDDFWLSVADVALLEFANGYWENEKTEWLDSQTDLSEPPNKGGNVPQGD